MATAAHEEQTSGRHETLGMQATEERFLWSREQVQIDVNSPLYDRRETGSLLGINGLIIASIDVGGSMFSVVDVRGTGARRDFCIVEDEEIYLQDGLGFKGIPKNKPIVLGRGHHTDRFTYSPTVSNDHLEITYNDDGLFITNLEPTNDTVVTACLVEPKVELRSLPPLNRHVARDARTYRANERLVGHPDSRSPDELAPYGYYKDLPKLGRNSTSVNGGVYLGGSPREAIVVDGESEELIEIYEDFLADLEASIVSDEIVTNEDALAKVMYKVQKILPYDDEKAEAMSRKYWGDKLVGLSEYLKGPQPGGVCRHQGLLAAYIVENLISDGVLRGSVGVERNTVQVMGGTHAWAIFKPEHGEAIVIDAAQSFVGTKRRAYHEGRWEYRLTTDEY